MAWTIDKVTARLREQLKAGRPLIGAGAGTGISAKSAEAGGVDLIVIYNSGRYRMAGRGSLAGLMPYGDANQIVVEMAREVLTVVKDTPVLAGMRHRSFPRHGILLETIEGHGICRSAKFPHRGPNRRKVPGQPGGNRNGLWAGDRNDQNCP